MPHRIKLISLNAVMALSLGGCSLFSADNGPQALRVEPSSGVQHGGPVATVQYELGRYHHARLNYERAAAGYGQALQADPTHVEARNGLAIVLAMQGRHDQALKELAAAIALAPQAAHLHNNLGYVHMLRGAHDQAVAAFALATRIDPGHKRAARNLAAAQAKARAEGMASQEVVTAPVSSERTVPAQPLPSTASRALPASSTPSSRIVPVSSQIYELRAEAAPRPPMTSTAAAQAIASVRTLAPAPVAPPAAMPASATPGTAALSRTPAARVVPVAIRPATDAPVSPRTVATSPTVTTTTTPKAAPVVGTTAATNSAFRLEISNGNGLNGFAKSVSVQLATLGVRTTRLTNQLPFEQPYTHIQYREGYRQAATTLAARLRSAVPVAPSATLAESTDVRLILGRDRWTVAAVLRAPQQARVHLVSAAAVR